MTVGETEAVALKITGAAYKLWHDRLAKLWRKNHVKGPSFARYMVDTVESE